MYTYIYEVYEEEIDDEVEIKKRNIRKKTETRELRHDSSRFIIDIEVTVVARVCMCVFVHFSRINDSCWKYMSPLI